MNAQKELQLRDTYERFMNLMMDDLSLDELNKVAERDVMGYGTTIDERIFEIEGLRNIIIAQREQGAGMQFSYDSKRMHNRISDQEDSALFVDEIKVVIEGNGMKSEIPVRITSLFFYRENTWKLVHWHGSVAVESEEDTWHLNEWKKKTEALEKLVTEKTVDLIQKNRELEIEAALERVRNRTLLMKDSSELNEAVAVFFQQLKTLNLLPTNSRTYFCDIDADTAVAKVWMTHSDGTVMQGSHQTPLTNSLSMINYFEAWKRKEPILERKYTGETLAEYLKFLSGLSHVQEDKDYRQLLHSPPQQIVMTDANFLQGNIGVMSFEPLSKEALSIMVRFAKLFEFTYTRFLDLQKAEAQAREAQIELGLERVRTKAMAMRDSDGLDEMIGTVLVELTKLDLELTRCIIMIFEPMTNASRWWMANSETPSEPMNFLVQAHENAPYQAFLKAWKEKTIKWQYDLRGKVKRDWDDFVFGKTELSRLPDFVIAGMKAPERVLLSASFNNFGCLNVASLEPLSDEHFDILLRFAKVFDLTYTRYNDLKQAEAQAREAEIQLALERVRARTMAMHKSDELNEVVAVMYQQMEPLGFAAGGCELILCNEQTNQMEYWHTNPVQFVPPECYCVPKSIDPFFEQQWNAWKERMPRLVIKLEGAEKRSLDILLLEQTDFKKISEETKQWVLGESVAVFSLITFKYGLLEAVDFGPLSEDKLFILERFANVFEQTYTRFLDLQKAEAQAREAEIQLALERLRARTMAMHMSDELPVVVFDLFEQMHHLGFAQWGASISLADEARGGFDVWFSTPENRIFSESHFLPNQGHPVAEKIWNIYKEQIELSTTELKDEVKLEYDQWTFANTPLGNMPENDKAEILSEHYVMFSISAMKYGFLEAMSHVPIPAELTKILPRFAKVFEQTYTRFLDLQKAEAQAREAQIEASLERVRARTMAMQRSEELPEVAALLFQQVKTLGVPQFHCGFNIFEIDDKECIWYPGSADGDILPPCKIPLTEHPVFMAFNESRKRGDELFVYEKEGEYQAGHYRYMLSLPVLGEILQNMLDAGIPFPTFQIDHLANFSHGNLLFITSEHFPEMHDTFKRFAKVFEQTYTRFLDLQKAEGQAREAQIEAALERVRARTMAMRGSEELLDVASILFQQVKALGVPQWNCGFNIWDIGDQEFTYYPGTPDGIISQSPCKIPLTEHPVFKSFDESRKRGDELFIYEKEGEMQRGHYQYMLSLPGVGDLLQSMLDAGFEFPTFQIDHVANFAYGNLIFITYEHFPEMHDVFKRFARVFEQTYTRFLDLQKAEAQAREAQIEYALEKVRSRTMAMQHSDELMETSELMFGQIKNLGIELWSCGFSLWYDDDSYFLGYNPGPNGKMGTPLRIPLTEDIFFSTIREAKRRGDDFLVFESKGETLVETYRFMDSLPVVGETMRGFVEAGFPLPTYQVTHCGFFSNGHLMFITEEPNSEATDIFKRFTKVFNQTYTRFLDLQKAEAQAREAKVEVALERIRARALAMQSSTELSEVAKVLRDQMGILGQEDLEASVVHLYSAGSPTFDSWYAFRAGDKIIEGQATFRLENSALAKEFLKLYEDEVTEYTIEVKGKKLKEWLAEIKRNAPKIAAYWGDLPPEKQFYHFSDFSGGALLMVSHENLTEETRMLQKRCASVFELAYKRFLDLESKERQERELLEEKQRLEQALSELKATQSQLIQSEKMASLGELTAGIAHEIQNPLNFVNNFSEVSNELIQEIQEERAKSKEERDEQLESEILEDIRQNLEKITLHGKRADSIVKGMLQHSRSSSGQKEPTDINILADEYLRLSYHGLRAKDKSFNADFKTNFAPDLPKIPVMGQGLGRVFLNLINNAFYAVTEKKKTLEDYKPLVEVTTKNLGSSVQIIISDNGGGIPENIKSKIFQPFFTTKPTGSGTGLGLSLSYDIVKAHGGELKVNSEEGKGTEFIITLPIS